MMHRRVTSRDVAERAGVSQTTVSLVLNDRGGTSIPEETRRRVHAVAAGLGYHPHASARALAKGRTDVLGIVIADEADFDGPDQFFQRKILHGLIHAVFRARRNPMLYSNLPHDPPDLHPFGDGRADGFLLVARGENDPLVAYLNERRIPFVVLAARVETAVGSWVDADNERGAAAAVAHLCDAGHTRIAHLAGPPGNANAAVRQAAFHRAMHERGLPVPEAYVRDGGFLSHTGEKAAGELLSLPERPTAIFAADDNMALGAYRAARRLGLRIPDDLSLVGFDDADYAQALDPPLTTLRQPLLAMAEAAVELLIDRLSHPEHPPSPRVLPTELVARASVASPPRERYEGEVHR
jgi:LacI family transcriptional regulator